MTDVVVTVPQRRWEEWIAEGMTPDDPLVECELCGDRLAPSDWHGHRAYEGYDEPRPEFYFSLSSQPSVCPGERIYIVALGRLRGYAPLVRVERAHHVGTACSLVRYDGAVAVTIPEPIRGFQGYRYRWWDYADEQPFPDWATA